MPRTIALLTDFGTADHFVGVMKGAILRLHENVHLIDISHDITPQDIVQGALVLKHAYAYFPEGTIFLTVVDPGVGSVRRSVIMKTGRYLFVAPDNGILFPVAQKEKKVTFYQITNSRYFLHPVSRTFHGRDIFAPVAAYLSRGSAPSRFGPPIKTIKELILPESKIDVERKSITGRIIAIDRFGNLITSITASEITRLKGTPEFRLKKKSIKGLSASYSAVAAGQLLAVEGSMGYVEIAVNRGSAAKMLHARKDDTVTVAGSQGKTTEDKRQQT